MISIFSLPLPTLALTPAPIPSLRGKHVIHPLPLPLPCIHYIFSSQVSSKLSNPPPSSARFVGSTPPFTYDVARVCPHTCIHIYTSCSSLIVLLPPLVRPPRRLTTASPHPDRTSHSFSPTTSSSHYINQASKISFYPVSVLAKTTTKYPKVNQPQKGSGAI